jgi:hypothetical protein
MIPIATRDTAASDRRSRRERRLSRRPVGALLTGTLLAGGFLTGALGGCSSSSHVDMWIAKDPDAGAGFVAPMREAGTDASDAADDSGAAGDNGNAGTTGSAGTNGSAGTTGTAGTNGSGGNAGIGGNAAGGAAGT